MGNSSHILRAPDYMKAFGITLVVFAHVLRGLIRVNALPPDAFWLAIDRAIYLFHMPLFFYVSGLFFRETVGRYGYKGMLKKNVFALLLPLVVWSYLQFSMQYVFSGSANAKVTLFDVLTAPFPPRQQFWFLGALFLTTAFVGALLYMRRATETLWLVLVAFLAARVVASDTIVQMFAANEYASLCAQFVVHVPFFVMGILTGTVFLRRIPADSVICLVLIAVALCVEQITPFAGAFVSMATSVLCVLGFYKIFLNLEQKQEKLPETFWSKAAVFIGMNSMIIYLAHVICAAAFRSALLKAGVSGSIPELWGGVLAGMGIPLLLVPVGIKLQKFYPRIAQAVLPVRENRK